MQVSFGRLQLHRQAVTRSCIDLWSLGLREPERIKTSHGLAGDLEYLPWQTWRRFVRLLAYEKVRKPVFAHEPSAADDGRCTFQCAVCPREKELARN